MRSPRPAAEFWTTPGSNRFFPASRGLTPDQLVAAASDPVERCEAYYYAGEVSLLQGELEAAVAWFEACLDTGLEMDPDSFWEPMSEYDLAEWRLDQLRKAQ